METLDKPLMSQYRQLPLWWCSAVAASLLGKDRSKCSTALALCLLLHAVKGEKNKESKKIWESHKAVCFFECSGESCCRVGHQAVLLGGLGAGLRVWAYLFPQRAFRP